MDKNKVIIIKHIQELTNDIDKLSNQDIDELANFARRVRMIIRNAPLEESSRSEYLENLGAIIKAYFPVPSHIDKNQSNYNEPWYDKVWSSGKKQISSLLNTMKEELELFEEKQ